MKKKSLFLFGILLLNAVLLLVFLFFSRESGNEIAFQKQCFDLNKNKMEVVIIGHCEGQSAINPYYFDQPTFNLSQRDQSPLYTKKLTQFLNPQDTPSLKKVLININPFSFSSRHLPTSRYVRDLFLYFGVLPDFNRDLRDGLVNFSFFYDEIERFFAQHIYKTTDQGVHLATSEYEKIESSESPTLFCNGYQESTNIFDTHLTKEFYSQYIQSFDFQDTDQGVENYDSILNYLEDHNYQTFIILGPRESTYFEYLKQQKSDLMQTFNQAIETLIARHPNVKVLNFSESKLFGNEDFFEPNILNQNGSEKISKYLNKILKSNNLEKRVYKGVELDLLATGE